MSEEPSLREEQVRQTRSALVAAARQAFGANGYAGASVDEVARLARVTTGALYHHFPTKTALFEAVFIQLHQAALVKSQAAASTSTDPITSLIRGSDAFLDEVLLPDVQRILLLDAPAVLGLERFTELDESLALDGMVLLLRMAGADDPETVARLVMGAITRGALLIAASERPKRTRNQVSAALAQLLSGVRRSTSPSREPK